MIRLLTVRDGDVARVGSVGDAPESVDYGAEVVGVGHDGLLCRPCYPNLSAPESIAFSGACGADPGEIPAASAGMTEEL